LIPQLTAHPPLKRLVQSGVESQTSFPNSRVLLALDGHFLTPGVLATAHACCGQLTDRLDILLVNSPKPPTSLLWRLLLSLEHANIDYRLTGSDGDLSEHILTYLHRFPSITRVLVQNLQSLEEALGARMTGLLSKGYRFIVLADPGNAYQEIQPIRGGHES
jgi:hypothetical protein